MADTIHISPYDNSVMPLGGIGAGCLSIDQQGRIYSHIAHPRGTGFSMANTCPAIRIQSPHSNVYARRLCGQADVDENPGARPRAVPFLAPHQLRGLINFPVATYQLLDEASPAQVTWSYFSPLIPYDHVASIMPATFLGIRVVNPTEHAMLCSVLFNLDATPVMALTDPTRQSVPIHAIRVSVAEDNRNHLGTNLFRGAIAQPDSGRIDETYICNAILMGERRSDGAGPQPQFCLCVKEHPDARISSAFWNTDSPKRHARFWDSFLSAGPLHSLPSSDQPNAGALCLSTRLPANASYRIDFILSWHLPPSACERHGCIFNYEKTFGAAPDTARYGLKHLTYLFSAIRNWHKQLTSSSLPMPFVTQLMNAGRVFVTHMRNCPDSGFKLATVLRGADVMEQSDWDFFEALATLMFAPRFHSAAVLTCLEEMERASHNGTDSDAIMRVQAELILSAYAEVLFNGNRARLGRWYPTFNRISNAIADRIISGAGEAAAFSAPTAGLWAVALRAMAQMALIQNDTNAVAYYDTAGHSLAREYSSRLNGIIETSGPATPTAPPGGPLLEALAGVCIAALLHLPPIVPDDLLRDIVSEKRDSSAAGADTRQRMRQIVVAMIIQVMYGSQAHVSGETAKLPELLEKFVYTIEATFKENLGETNVLGLWAVLFASTGVQYDALSHALLVRPSPLALTKSELPIFSPVSLGKMATGIEQEQDRIVLIRITFDTPLTIKTAKIELPFSFASVKVSCAHDTETLSIEQHVTPSPTGSKIHLRFKSPLKLTSMLSVRLREAEEQTDARKTS